jgi:Ion channel
VVNLLNCLLISTAFSISRFFLLPRGQYLVALFSIFIVAMCVMVHYEVLRKLSDWLVRLHHIHRTRVLVLIIGLFATHVFEIWIYAIAFGLLDGASDFGTITHFHDQSVPATWLDYVYFSFMTYTTVGYGDLVPRGPIRFIAATEALTGWVLLGWSASFTFLEMERFWRNRRR